MDRYLIIKINAFNEISALSFEKNFSNAKNKLIEITGKEACDGLCVKVKNDTYFIVCLNEKKFNFKLN